MMFEKKARKIRQKKTSLKESEENCYEKDGKL